ncbi:MAG: ankyrin repeat domain-containing protein [Helicobacteraceae bacterium]|jgi:ankyrin repeat protein|nr:ankyrin repeat domain-containing protein [Helicobacteraceae bacterium]
MRALAALIALSFLLSACAQSHVAVTEPREEATVQTERKIAPKSSLTRTLVDYYAAARSEDTSAQTIAELSATLERLIEGGGSKPDASDAQGFTPLAIAAQANDRLMIERLCKAGANYDARAAHGLPLLVLALQEGALESAKALLACGASPNVGGDKFASPLTIAVLGGITSVDYRQMAIELLDRGADANLGAIGERPLLLYAIMTSQGDLARKMIEKGANIELADDEGMTPLTWAILLKDDETVATLLDKGATPDATDAHGYSPLNWAIFADNQTVVASIIADRRFALKESDRGSLAAQLAKNRSLAELRALVAGEAVEAKPSAASAPIDLPSIARFKGMEFLSLEYGGSKIAFKTTDPLLRHFALENPPRLVLDFSRANAVQSLTMPLDPNGTFQRAAIGRHTGSYRAVIFLSGSRKYDLEGTAEGPVVTLR